MVYSSGDDPMSALFKIGDVAILLGISSETIRRYEEHGIVTPVKSKSTGYRYFKVWDIRVLTRARMYRKLGYSLAEVAELINHDEVPGIVTSLSQKESEIEKQITMNLNLLKHIRWMQSTIVDADATIGKYRVEYRPPMYRIDLNKFYELYSDPDKQELYRSWSSKEPYVFPSDLFQKDILKRGEYDISCGLVISQENENILNIKESNEVTFYPSRLCIYTTVQTDSERVFSYEDFEPILNYINKQGMKLCDDVISRVVLTKKKDNKYCSWHQLWLPIE